ncbi:hypothetical protein ANN_04399 [Periplaneta americana]|uniref:Uncharacterized protein n=1 Tax=Periplaneta americana TaxID=6978 RepID=A0ABQ8T9N0_PERAM|nr:hypothetical protein ANN_04399 [Periplaneta americana]
MGKRKLSAGKRAAIVSLHTAGHGMRQIAKQEHVSLRNVHYTVMSAEQSDDITVFRIPTMTSLMLHRCRTGSISLQRWWQSSSVAISESDWFLYGAGISRRMTSCTVVSWRCVLLWFCCIVCNEHNTLASVAQTTTCTAAMIAIEPSSSFVPISLERDVIVVHRSGEIRNTLLVVVAAVLVVVVVLAIGAVVVAVSAVVLASSSSSGGGDSTGSINSSGGCSSSSDSNNSSGADRATPVASSDSGSGSGGGGSNSSSSTSTSSSPSTGSSDSNSSSRSGNSSSSTGSSNSGGGGGGGGKSSSSSSSSSSTGSSSSY